MRMRKDDRRHWCMADGHSAWPRVHALDRPQISSHQPAGRAERRELDDESAAGKTQPILPAAAQAVAGLRHRRCA